MSETQESHNATTSSAEPTKKEPFPSIASIVRPYSQSPLPMWSVSGLFLASSFIPHSPTRTPLMYRVGFGSIFAGAGYGLAVGDVYNGSGISTAWSLIYLFFNLRKSLTTQRSPLSLALSAATIASSALYGTEYFLLQNSDA